jgi:hypothetical protein
MYDLEVNSVIGIVQSSRGCKVRKREEVRSAHQTVDSQEVSEVAQQFQVVWHEIRPNPWSRLQLAQLSSESAVRRHVISKAGWKTEFPEFLFLRLPKPIWSKLSRLTLSSIVQLCAATLSKIQAKPPKSSPPTSRARPVDDFLRYDICRDTHVV